jgi:hypothetical protein
MTTAAIQMDGRWLRTEDAAAYIGVSPSWLAHDRLSDDLRFPTAS